MLEKNCPKEDHIDPITQVESHILTICAEAPQDVIIVAGDFNTDVGRADVYDLTGMMQRAGLSHSSSPSSSALALPTYVRSTRAGTRLDYQLLGGPAVVLSCEVIDDFTGTTGHAPLVGWYTIETVGTNKRHNAIKPMTLYDVKLRQKDKVEHMAQLLQYLPLYDNLDPEARLETLTDGIVRCAQLNCFSAFPPRVRQENNGWSPTTRLTNIVLDKIKLIRRRVQGYRRWTELTVHKGLREVLHCWDKDLEQGP